MSANFASERAEFERQKGELKQQVVTASMAAARSGGGPPGPPKFGGGGAANGGSMAPQSVEGSVQAVCNVSNIVGEKEKIFFKLRANWRTQLKVLEATIVEMHRIYKRDIGASGGGQQGPPSPPQQMGGPPAFGSRPPGPGVGGPPAFGGRPPGPSNQSWRS